MASEPLGAAPEEGSPREEHAPQPSAASRRRLHPASPLFSIARTLRAFLLPAIVALLSGSETLWAIVGLVMGVPAIGLAIVRHLTLRWSLRPEELFVEEGLWFRSERHVPYARIQDVDLVQGLVHRLLGVAEVRVQTAAGSEPEAVLRVLGMRDVELLRAAVRTPVGRPARAPVPHEPAPPAPPAELAAKEVLVEDIPIGRLVALGLVLHRGLAVVGAGFVLLMEADLLEPLIERLPLGRWLGDLFDRPGGAVLVLLLLLGGGVLCFTLLSVAWSVVRFGGYRLERVGEVLHVRCGLLTRVSASVPLARIQSLTVEETWVHRLFGCATLVARTAGATAGTTANDDDPSAALRSRFVPILPMSQVPVLAQALLPGTTVEGLTWHPLGPGAAARAARRAVLLLLLVMSPLLGMGLWTLGERAALPALLILVSLAAVVGAVSARAARRTRWARAAWGFALQRGVLNRRTTLLPVDRIQTVRTAQSPFDRRHAHATFTLDAAGGSLHTSEVRARYMDAEQARTLHDDLGRAIAGSEFHPRGPKLAGGGRHVGGGV